MALFDSPYRTINKILNEVKQKIIIILMDYNYSLYNQMSPYPVCYENESPNLLWNIFYVWSLISIQFGVTTFAFIWVDKYISPKEGGYY